MRPDLFIQKWPGPRSVMRKDVADTLRLPASSRDFLVVAGLPVDVGFNNIGFDISGPSARRLRSHPSFVQINRPGSGAFVCLDEDSLGAVIQVEKSPGGERQLFLNSSVEQHAEFWLAWRMIVQTSGADTGDTLGRLLRQTLGEIDPPAIADEDLPWSILVEEVETGVL